MPKRIGTLQWTNWFSSNGVYEAIKYLVPKARIVMPKRRVVSAMRSVRGAGTRISFLVKEKGGLLKKMR